MRNLAKASSTTLLVVVALATSGCEFHARAGTRSPSTPAQQPAAAPAGQSTATAAGGSTPATAGQPATAQPAATQPAAGGGSIQPAVQASADCPNPANHCLQEDVVLIGKKEYKKGYIYLMPARQTAPANAAGEATFLQLKNGETVTTRHVFKTRPATREELLVGRLATMLHKRKGGVYVPPESREQAQSDRWWLARIISVANKDQGFILISGGYKVDIRGVRLVEGDESPTTSISPQVDEHFLSPEHYIIASKPLPDKNYIYAAVGAPVQEPSPQTNNEGHFVNLHTGEITWTGHAWKTRPATQADLKPGVYAFVLHKRQGGTYVKPSERTQALSDRWWIMKITDTSQLYRGTVGVAGGYTVSADAIRVAVQ